VEHAHAGIPFLKNAAIADAVDALILLDLLRRNFFGHERFVTTLYNAVKPDSAALAFSGRVACLAAIADAIRAKLNPNPTDISEVMGDINKLTESSVSAMFSGLFEWSERQDSKLLLRTRLLRSDSPLAPSKPGSAPRDFYHWPTRICYGPCRGRGKRQATVQAFADRR
jgi:hypothetical protein